MLALDFTVSSFFKSDQEMMHYMDKCIGTTNTSFSVFENRRMEMSKTSAGLKQKAIDVIRSDFPPCPILF